MARVLCTGVDPVLMKTRQLILESAGHTVVAASDEREIKSLGKSKTLWTLLGRVREDIAARMNFDANYVFIARLPRCQWRDRS